MLNGRGKLQLLPGPYLEALKVLSLSWHTLLDGHQELSACAQLSKLCLGHFGHREPFLVGQQGAGDDFLSDESDIDEDWDEEMGWDAAQADVAEDAAGGAEADAADQQEGAAAEGAAGIAAGGAAGPEVQQGPAEPALAQLAAQAFGPLPHEGGGLGLQQQPEQQQQGDEVLGGGVVPAAAGPAADVIPAAPGPSEPLSPDHPKTRPDVAVLGIIDKLTAAVREMEGLGEAMRREDPDLLTGEVWEVRVAEVCCCWFSPRKQKAGDDVHLCCV